MPTDLLDDEYVANLLKQDAKNATKSYQLVGIDAFNPNRLRAAAPKPNTNFLRHIIRQTDSHNAALLAKEAEESRARLKQMDKTKNREERRIEQRKSRKSEGRLTPISSDGETEDRRSRKRKDYSSEDDAKADSRRRRRHREEPRDARSRRDRSRSRDRHKEPRLRDVDEDTHSKARHSRRRHKERRRGHRSEDENARSYPNDESKHRRSRKRSHTRSASPRRSRSPRSSKHHRRSRYRSRSRSPKRVSKYHDRPRNKDEKADGQRRSKRRSASLPSDSDPLEAIVGPLPPTAQPTVRSRGRGAHKANSMGMDARFSSTYDPAVDIGIQSDEEDTWGDALEAVQDRQRWKKQGAERLKAAGFTNEQVEKWENGDEKTEDDVVWAMKGEAREWDRGKVVDQDGDVDLKAEWRRLK